MLTSFKRLRDLHLLRVVSGVALLCFLFSNIPFQQTLGALKKASLAHFLGAISVLALANLVSAYKLRMLTRLKSQRMTLRSALRVIYVGFFFNNFMPTSIGGDIFAINEMKRYKIDFNYASQAVFVSRLTGTAALLLFAFFFFLPGKGLVDEFGLSQYKIYWIVFIVCVTAVVLFFVGFWKKFLKWFLKERAGHPVWGAVYKIFEGFYVYKDNPAVIASAILLSCLYHCAGAASIFILTQSFGPPVSYLSLLLILPIVNLVSMLPVSIGALGVKEGALVFCLGKLGFPLSGALAVSLLFRLCFYVHSIAGGFLYSLRTK